MKTWGWNLAFYIFTIYLFGCAQLPDPTLEFRENLRREVNTQQWIFQDLNASFSPFMEQYIVHWKFREFKSPWGNKTRVAFRLFDCSQDDLFAVVFVPPRPPRGTFFILHGYLASLGNFSGIIRVMLEEGWAVTAMDLPGHGLSGGARADAKDFIIYQKSLKCWLEKLSEIRTVLPRPWVVLGHSTGASAIVDYSVHNELPWDLVILSAPLIRHVWWELGQGLSWVNQWWLKSIQPLVSPDPLVGIYNVPISWVLALGRWESQLRLKAKSEVSVLFHQDRDDQVVLYQHNLPLLGRGFPNNKVFWQQGMGHVTLADFHRYHEAFLPILDWILENQGVMHLEEQ